MQKNRLSDRIRVYGDCDIYWLPLNRDVRDKMNMGKFFNFMFKQIGKPYDTEQAIKSALDLLSINYNREDFSKMFCSELALAGLESSGGCSGVNASEVYPQQLCEYRLFEDEYFMVNGFSGKRIKRYNTVKI